MEIQWHRLMIKDIRVHSCPFVVQNCFSQPSHNFMKWVIFGCDWAEGDLFFRCRSGSAHGQMGIDHGNDMACGAERPGLDSVLFARVSVILSGIQLVIWARTDIVCLVGVMVSPMVAWWLPLRCPWHRFFQLRRQVMGRLWMNFEKSQLFLVSLLWPSFAEALTACSFT